MTPVKEKIVLSHTEIFLRKDGIVEVLVKESSVMGLIEVKEVITAYKEFLENKKYPVIHIIENYVSIDNEAREYAASDEGVMFSKAEAFVINSLPHKILANFYMKVNQPPIPTKFFSNREDALAWLNEYL